MPSIASVRFRMVVMVCPSHHPNDDCTLCRLFAARPAGAQDRFGLPAATIRRTGQPGSLTDPIAIARSVLFDVHMQVIPVASSDPGPRIVVNQPQAACRTEARTG